MAKNVLVISASMRANSNSDMLAAAFADGAAAAGNRVETVSLKGKSIAFCRGCLACQKLGRCVIADDAVEITEKMKNADVIAFATPIYYYEMSGQLKTLLDRANSLFPSDYAFRETYFLSCATEDEPTRMSARCTALRAGSSAMKGTALPGRCSPGACRSRATSRGIPRLKRRVRLARR